LSDELVRISAPGGILILSGILREQVDDVEKKILEEGLKTDLVFHMEEWACMIARKLQ